MLEILKPAVTTKEYAYRRIFRTDYECFGFLCDEDGNPIFKSPREEKIFQECLSKPNKYKDCGREKREATIFCPAIARCECGKTLRLEKKWQQPAIICNCGRMYESGGKELKGGIYDNKRYKSDPSIL